MFDGIMWEDTWLLGWHRAPTRLILLVDVSLWPGHPAYQKPQPGEWTCYKRGRLVFEAVSSVEGLPSNESGTPPYADANGERDFGSINSLTSIEGGYRVMFDSGDVRIQCDGVRLEFDTTAPAG